MDAVIDLALPVFDGELPALGKLSDGAGVFAGNAAAERLAGFIDLACSSVAFAFAEDAADACLGLLGQLLKRRATGLDELSHRTQGDEVLLTLLFLEDDLRERDRGQVFFASVVEHLDFFALTDHQRDLLQGDVLAALRVVQLAVTVALDNARLWHNRCASRLWPYQRPFQSRSPDRGLLALSSA